MNFFGIGALELLMILVLALILFGPHKLSGMARNLGKTLDEIRRQTREAQDALTRGLEEDRVEIPKLQTRALPPKDRDDSPVGLEH